MKYLLSCNIVAVKEHNIITLYSHTLVCPFPQPVKYQGMVVLLIKQRESLESCYELVGEKLQEYHTVDNFILLCSLSDGSTDDSGVFLYYTETP